MKLSPFARSGKRPRLYVLAAVNESVLRKMDGDEHTQSSSTTTGAGARALAVLPSLQEGWRGMIVAVDRSGDDLASLWRRDRVDELNMRAGKRSAPVRYDGAFSSLPK